MVVATGGQTHSLPVALQLVVHCQKFSTTVVPIFSRDMESLRHLLRVLQQEYTVGVTGFQHVESGFAVQLQLTSAKTK